MKKKYHNTKKLYDGAGARPDVYVIPLSKSLKFGLLTMGSDFDIHSLRFADLETLRLLSMKLF